MAEDPYPDSLLKYIGMSQGWLCPRCQRVNAPWAAVCPCSHVYIVSTPAPTQPYYPGGTGDPGIDVIEPGSTGDPLPGQEPFTVASSNDKYKIVSSEAVYKEIKPGKYVYMTNSIDGASGVFGPFSDDF